MSRQEAGLSTVQAPVRRGRRPQISADDIVEAATRRIGTEWTVAAVAADLGVTDAAIYRYFPSRKAILLEVGNRWIAELAVPDYAGDWRAFLQELARSWYELYVNFPAFLDLGAWAGLSSPQSVAYWDRVLTQVRAAGVAETDLHTVVSSLQAISREGALAALADDKLSKAPVLIEPGTQLVPPRSLTALGTHTATEVFERILDLVLDGIERRVSNR